MGLMGPMGPMGPMGCARIGPIGLIGPISPIGLMSRTCYILSQAKVLSADHVTERTNN